MKGAPYRLAGLSCEAVSGCSEQDQRRLLTVALLYLVGPLLCGLSGAAFGAMVAGSRLASLSLGGVAFLFNWNLVRLLVAGSGVAPHYTNSEADQWTPSLHQVVVLTAWTLLQVPILAAFLLMSWGLLDAHLAEWRVLQSQLSPDTSLAEPGLLAVLTIAGYRMSTWTTLTVGLVVVAVSGPLCRIWYAPAYAAYARRLRDLQRRRITAAQRRKEHALARMFLPFRGPGGRPACPPLYADPPFNREAVPPHPIGFHDVREAKDLPSPTASPPSRPV